jgi:hypothetical protein
VGAEQEARFKIGVDVDGGDETESLAQSLQGLQSQIKADKAALTEMTGALRAMQGGTSVSISAFAQLRAEIEAKKSAIAGATESYVTLGGAFGKIKADAGGAAESLDKVAASAEKSGKKAADGSKAAATGMKDAGAAAKESRDGIKGMLESVEKGGGVLGQFAGKLRGVVEAGGKLGGSLFIVAAAAVVAFVAALAAGAIALVSYAIKAADAARDQRLLMQAFEASKPALAGVGKAIKSVHDATGVGVDKLKGFAKQLEASKVSAKDMPAALRALATAEAALGEGGAAEFAEQLKSGKKSVAELAKEVDSKFGGIVKARMLGLGAQFAKAKENVASLFAGLKLEGFLTALKGILDLLDANTSSGRALRNVAEKMLQPIIDGLTAAGPIAKAFFKGLVVGALLVAIGFFKVRNALRDAFGGDAVSSIDTVRTAMYVGAAIVIGFVAALALLAAGVAAVVGVFFGLQMAVSAAFDAVMNFDFGALGSAFADGASGAAAALVEGLVAGILAGTGPVGSAMASLAGSAVKALMGGLDARSPSRKTMKGGQFAGQGVVVGAKSEKKNVEDAMRGLVQIPSDVDPEAQGAAAGKGVAKGAAGAAAGEGGAGGASSGKGGGRKLEVHFHGVPGAKEMATDAWLEKAADALEEAAARGGVSLEEAA